MCGLIGVIGDTVEADKKAFRDMVIFDTVRGQDSTGIMYVRRFSQAKHPKIEMEWALGGPTNLWEDNQSGFMDYRGISVGYPKVLMGHNRAATMGAVDLHNAHPFEMDNIIGAHNGTLTNWVELDAPVEEKLDSRALFTHIDKHGIADAWKKFNGAAAITVFDKKEEHVTIVRNSERTLFYAARADGRALYYASEAWMITVAASRNGVKLEEWETGEHKGKVKVRPFQVDVPYKITPTTQGFEIESGSVLEKKPQPHPTHGNYGWTGGQANYGFKQGNTNKSKGNGTTTSTALGMISASNLEMNRKWVKENFKKKLVRTGMDVYNIYMSRLRLFHGPSLLTIRADLWRIEEDGKDYQLGIVDIIPQNKKEGMRLAKLIKDDKDGKVSFLSLITSPRREDTNYIPAMPRFFVSAGSVLIKYEEKKEEKLEFVGEFGEKLSEIEFEKLFRSCGQACAQCDDTLDRKDNKKFLWMGPREALCPDCSNKFVNSKGLN